jgi:hypothetical protein
VFKFLDFESVFVVYIFRSLQKERRILQAVNVTPQVTPPPAPVTVNVKTVETRADLAKKTLRRLNAKLRKRRSREMRSRQKVISDNKKQREYYHKKKETKIKVRLGFELSERAQKSPKSYLHVLKMSLRQVAHRRDRQSLIKLHALKRILHRQADETQRNQTFYMRKQKSIDLKIQTFYHKVAVNLPGKRTVSAKDMKPKKILTKKIQDVYRDFKKENPRTVVSFSTFARRRPRDVLLSSKRAFHQCLCEHCTNAKLKMEKLNPYLPSSCKVTDVDQLVEETLCRSHEQTGRACIDRHCDLCGPKIVTTKWRALLKEQTETPIAWQKWEKTEQSSKDFVEKAGTISTMIDELEKELKGLARHVKTAKWQREQYNSLSENLPFGHAIVTLDYAENYACKFQNEVQSAHWSYRQITIHPCVIQYRCQKEGCSELVTDYLVELSDDLNHDAGFTKAVMVRVMEHIKKLNMSKVYLFSDGCSCQYKSKLPFYMLTELQQDYPDIDIERHFFGSGHGKSLCDSCGGVVKSCATRGVASGRAGTHGIQRAAEMLMFGADNLTIHDKPDVCVHVVRSFELIGQEDIDRSIPSKQVDTLPGTRQLHAMKPSKETVGKVFFKELSCFCTECETGLQTCSNASFTGDLKEYTIRRNGEKQTPPTPRQARSDQSNHGKQTSTISPSSGQSKNAKPTSTTQTRSGQSNSLQTDQSNESEDRKNFFKDAQNMLKSSNFEELLTKASDLAESIEKWPTYSTNTASEVEALQVDGTALKNLSDELTLKYLPIKVQADGNCFFRSLSLLASGTEDNHVEFRVRTVVDMLVRAEMYTDPDYLKVKSGYNDIVEFLTCSLEPTSSGTEEIPDDPLHLKALLRQEIQTICSLNTPCGSLHMFPAANVLSATIVSVYPRLGGEENQDVFNKHFKPADQSNQVQAIMWTSNRQDMRDDYWVANHVVPLLPVATESERYFF